MSKKIIKIIHGMNQTMYMELRNGRWYRADKNHVRHLVDTKDAEFVQQVPIPNEVIPA